MGMIDKTKHEEVALEAASDLAGEYIETLPTTDMAGWTHEQWSAFIEVVVGGFTDKMREQATYEAPF